MRVIAVRALKGSLEEAPREVANGQQVRVSRCASPAGATGRRHHSGDRRGRAPIACESSSRCFQTASVSQCPPNRPRA